MRRNVPEELSGVLNWALDGLDMITKQKKFTVSKTMEDTRKQYLFLGDNQSKRLQKQG